MSTVNNRETQMNRKVTVVGGAGNVGATVARAIAVKELADVVVVDIAAEKAAGIALDIYLSGESGPRGCFTVMTAASEAVSDPDIRSMVLEGLTELDKAFGIFKKGVCADLKQLTGQQK